MKIAEFDLRGHRTEAELVKENSRTVIVVLRRGGKSRRIKRHKIKHRVIYENMS